MKTLNQRTLARTLPFLMVSVMIATCSLSTKPGGDKSQAGSSEIIVDSPAAKKSFPNTKAIPHSHFLTLADAQKIMGEPAHLIDSTTTIGTDETSYQSAYQADEVDAKTQKTGAIYFILQGYNELSAAQKRYSSIKDANKDHGIKELTGLGDEAYFHTDNENFYFIMVRKGINVFNIKVNKITSKTSLDAFNKVAREITADL